MGQNSWGVGSSNFSIGRNNAATGPNSAITILSNGDTGIGTITPTNKLHVSGTTRFDNDI